MFTRRYFIFLGGLTAVLVGAEPEADALSCLPPRAQFQALELELESVEVDGVRIEPPFAYRSFDVEIRATPLTFEAVYEPLDSGSWVETYR